MSACYQKKFIYVSISTTVFLKIVVSDTNFLSFKLIFHFVIYYGLVRFQYRKQDDGALSVFAPQRFAVIRQKAFSSSCFQKFSDELIPISQIRRGRKATVSHSSRFKDSIKTFIFYCNRNQLALWEINNFELVVNNAFTQLAS